MNRMFAGGLMALALTGLAAGAAQAATITYKITGAGVWTLAGITQRGTFTITAVGDTTNAYDDAGTWFNNTSDFTFDLNGTTYGYGDTTGYVFDNNPGLAAGMGVGLTGDFLDCNGNAAFATYDLMNNLSPKLGNFQNVAPEGVQTTGGYLIFTAVDSLAFSATVPEPATWALMLAGFAGLGGALRSRRRLAAA